MINIHVRHAKSLGYCFAAGLIGIAGLCAMPAAQAEGRAETLVLTPATFARLIVQKNAEVASSTLTININRNLRDAEAALYEPVATSGFRHEQRVRLNTVEEQIISSSLPILDEKVYSANLGVKMAVPTGGNVKLDYLVESRKSNVIEFQSKGMFGAEYTGALGLSFEQPLGRGAGRSITETAKQAAEFDFQIAREKFTLQVYKSLTNALDGYWQLYRWQRIAALRKDSLDQATRLLETSRQRIAAGRAAASSLLEVQSVMLTRDIEFHRAQQSVLDATSSVMSQIGLSRALQSTLTLVPEIEISNAFVERTTRRDEIDVSTDAGAGTGLGGELALRWPTLRIAELERQQADVKSAYFRNQAKPLVNLVVNYQSTGFAYQRNSVNPLIAKNNYPDWFVGVNVELPLAGNRRAKSVYQAQEERVTQLIVEMEGLKVTHRNEYVATAEQLRAGTKIVTQSRAEVALRQQLFDNDMQRFKLGNITYSLLAQKESELLDAKVRSIENEARLEYSKLLYLYYRDVALESYSIHLDN